MMQVFELAATCSHWDRTAAGKGQVGLDQDTLAGHEVRGIDHVLRQGGLPGEAAVVQPVRDNVTGWPGVALLCTSAS
jgi:hypothetical protein